MIDIRPVSLIVGWLVLLLGATMLLPFGLDLLDRDPNAGAFAVSAVLTPGSTSCPAVRCSGAGSSAGSAAWG